MSFGNCAGIRLEQRSCGGECVVFAASWSIVRLRKRLLLELSRAIEAHDRADDHVADLELLADAAGGAGGDHQLGLHLD